jgi:hypothetical protein
MNILYIGSGNSATLVHKIDLTKFDLIICVNNAWKLFENSHFDYWIHSGDFPNHNRPIVKNFTCEISYDQYKNSCENVLRTSKNMEVRSPQHYLGYTIFFQGLYYIIDSLKPTKINLLGFDHDYNPEKSKMWIENGMPTPHNKYLQEKSPDPNQWAVSFFKDYSPDFFYGHGTPDPLRLSENTLIQKFELAIEICNIFNIELVNLSPVESKINMIKKEVLCVKY